MSQNSKENFTYFSHDMAVADAMMFAQAYFHKMIEQKSMKDGVKIKSNEDLEEALVTESDAKCFTGSALVLYYLKKHFASDFDVLVFAKGKMLPEFVNHIRFIAHCKNKWYSGSPANHEMNSQNSRMVRVSSATSIEGLFSQIQKEDGGIWPKSEYIRDVLSQENLCTSKLSVPGFPVIETLTFEEGTHRLGLHAVPIIETGGLIKLDITAGRRQSRRPKL